MKRRTLISQSSQLTKNFVIWITILLSLQGMTNIALADELVKTVQFAKGEHSTTINESLIRGETQKYIFYANAGQQMTAKIFSVENNAVFQIRTSKGKDFLLGAGEKNDAKEWAGELPVSGKYVIVVGSIRGNATYTLQLTIESKQDVSH